MAGYRAIAIDMRGYGGSTGPEDPLAYTPFHTVADMVGLLDALGLPTVTIVGHDFGAATAWYAAMMRPDRFTAVFGSSVPYLPLGGPACLKQWKRLEKPTASTSSSNEKPEQMRAGRMQGRPIRVSFTGLRRHRLCKTAGIHSTPPGRCTGQTRSVFRRGLIQLTSSMQSKSSSGLASIGRSTTTDRCSPSTISAKRSKELLFASPRSFSRERRME